MPENDGASRREGNDDGEEFDSRHNGKTTHTASVFNRKSSAHGKSRRHVTHRSVFEHERLAFVS